MKLYKTEFANVSGFKIRQRMLTNLISAVSLSDVLNIHVIIVFLCAAFS